MQMAVMLHSALVHLPPESPVEIVAVNGGISGRTAERIERVVRNTRRGRDTIRWAHPELGRLAGLKTSHHITSATYLRLFIPELLPPNQERALYLDCDLVVEADLTALWSLPLGDAAIAAVQDYFAPYVSSPFALLNYQKLGHRPDTPYFNAGVMDVNVAWWRTHDVPARVESYLRRYHQDVVFWDNDGLNAILAGNWVSRDLRWNQTGYLFDFDKWPDTPFRAEVGGRLEQLQKAPFTVHFAGQVKPWEPQSRHPLRSRFDHYLRSSGWFSELGFRRWQARRRLARLYRSVARRIPWK
jgi:lipopolysaccharide biosynthesis glycosyltransferase